MPMQAVLTLRLLGCKLDELRQAAEVEEFEQSFFDFLANAKDIVSETERGQASANVRARMWWRGKTKEMDQDDVMTLVRGHTYVRLLYAIDPGPISTDGKKPPMPAGWWTHRGEDLLHVAFRQPPCSHLGKSIRKNDPISVCELITSYLAEMVWRARILRTGPIVAAVPLDEAAWEA